MNEQIVFPESPAEFDEMLSEVQGRRRAAQDRIEYCVRRAPHRVAGAQEMSPAEFLEATEGSTDYYAKQARTELVDMLGRRWEAEAEIRQFAVEYERRGRWSRFYMVQAKNGHIHSSMDCQTCNRNLKATSFAWLTDLSGLSEKEAVAMYGAILCTVCFPSAPLEWTNGYEVEAAKKKAAQCPGSGTYLDSSQPHRKGYYSGNWGTCPDCGDKVTLTKNLNLRAHKPAA